MSEPITITIPGAPPSPNRTVREGSWHARAASRRQWRDAACWAARAVHGARPPLGAVTIEMTHVVPDRRRRDLDNLATAATKPYLDGLVDSGLLSDDSSDVVTAITHRAELVRGLRETRIVITPLHDGGGP